MIKPAFDHNHAVERRWLLHDASLAFSILGLRDGIFSNSSKRWLNKVRSRGISSSGMASTTYRYFSLKVQIGNVGACNLEIKQVSFAQHPHPVTLQLKASDDAPKHYPSTRKSTCCGSLMLDHGLEKIRPSLPLRQVFRSLTAISRFVRGNRGSALSSFLLLVKHSCAQR